MALVIKSKFNFSSYNLIKNVILDFGKCNPIKITFGRNGKVSMQQVIEAQIAEHQVQLRKKEKQEKLFNEAFIRYMRRKRLKEYSELMEVQDEQSDFDGAFDA